MITQRLMVIQKVDEKGMVDIFQITSNNINWTFENRRNKAPGDKEYFPFILNGDLRIDKVRAGAETRIFTRENEIIFCDDYGVPAGILIGILFPRNFIPDVFKFKDGKYIPTGLIGQVNTRPPGHIQILYNQFEKNCAVIFHVHEATLFGFKCIVKKVHDDAFPQNESVVADDLFDLTISRELLNVDAISNDDLKFINETLNQADLTDIQIALNELLITLKRGQKEKSQFQLNKIGILLNNVTSLASSLTTIADSYKEGNAAKQFIGRVFEYISL